MPLERDTILFVTCLVICIPISGFAENREVSTLHKMKVVVQIAMAGQFSLRWCGVMVTPPPPHSRGVIHDQNSGRDPRSVYEYGFCEFYWQRMPKPLELKGCGELDEIRTLPHQGKPKLPTLAPRCSRKGQCGSPYLLYSSIFEGEPAHYFVRRCISSKKCLRLSGLTPGVMPKVVSKLRQLV